MWYSELSQTLHAESLAGAVDLSASMPAGSIKPIPGPIVRP